MLAVAAATEDDNKSENDDPSAVIVEEMTKAVIHKAILPCRAEDGLDLAVFPPYINILCKAFFLVTQKCISFFKAVRSIRNVAGTFSSVPSSNISVAPRTNERTV